MTLGVVATALGLGSSLAAGPRPAAAECDGPYPDFRKLTATATTILIGDVVEVRGGGGWDPADAGVSSRFTLQVRYVLRGDSPEFVAVKDLPTQPCAPIIGARHGDRIALALDGLDYEPPMKVNMIAWIDAPPPPGFGDESASRGLTLSVADVYALVGLEPPAASAAGAPGSEGPPADGSPPILPVLLLVLAAAAVIAAAAWWLRGRPDEG